MTPEQQATINILTYLAALVTVIGSIAVNSYRVRNNVHAEAVRTQAEATKVSAAEIPNLAAQMTQISLDTSATLKQVVENQAQNTLNTKRLIDAREPLESLIAQAIEAIQQSKDANLSMQQVLMSGMREMRGAQGTIISTIIDNADANTAGLSAALSGINATATGNASKLTALDEQMKAHSAMTDEAFRKFSEKVELLPTKDEIRAILIEMQERVSTLEGERDRLQRQVLTQAATIAQLQQEQKQREANAASEGVE